MFFKIDEKKIPEYNTDLGLEKIILYDSEKAKEFNAAVLNFLQNKNKQPILA